MTVSERRLEHCRRSTAIGSTSIKGDYLFCSICIVIAVAGTLQANFESMNRKKSETRVRASTSGSYQSLDYRRKASAVPFTPLTNRLAAFNWLCTSLRISDVGSRD